MVLLKNQGCILHFGSPPDLSSHPVSKNIGPPSTEMETIQSLQDDTLSQPVKQFSKEKTFCTYYLID